MEKNGPWTTLSKEERYATPWIAVAHHEVIDPAGRPGIYGVVHFRNIAVGIVPLDAHGHTWIVGQHRYPIGRYSWEIPEGGAPRDAPPLESARRELKEETGITAGRWTEILRMDLSNSASDEEAIVYVAQDLAFGEAEPESTEDLTVRKLPFDELHDMVLRGEVRDGITIAAVLKVRLMLDSGTLRLQK
ncbi:MAG: NUDIX hydrolase [Flavobacteriales bacterium]|nr:NUDIX hydrolase [Flavobacteriales bacterium]